MFPRTQIHMKWFHSRLSGNLGSEFTWRGWRVCALSLKQIDRGTVVSEPDMTLFLKILMKRKVEGDGVCLHQEARIYDHLVHKFNHTRKEGGGLALCLSNSSLASSSLTMLFKISMVFSDLAGLAQANLIPEASISLS